MLAKFCSTVLLLVIAATAPAADKDAWYAKAVKGAEVAFEPAEAKPGQTVTFKLTITLNDGYYTYPLKQPDANAKGMVNKFKFPAPGSVVFVGDAADPEGYDTKAEPLLEILELRTYKKSVTFERKAVVSPKAKAGETTVKLDGFLLTVCDASNCYPTKTLTPEAKLKVLDGSVEVEKAYTAEVAKALEPK
ncbi:protein-disulfide reductase DsbD family protein [Limnoglobus roseus]|uniref:Thiol:disulfide interchange protein DsbD 2 n=1 Tax=Limnoglobus roseus TaxID=2598579 RepID=A0A5C1AIX7_9BACT|nr:protein-disulfide reductase DsbD family protein [Limnoglobus roseus]QEL18203.1 thiol:disulfide interchange protein DsbD 2 [Limnoglobus roseus]